MTTTLLIPTLSRFDLLKRLLESEKKQTKRVDDIIVVDNSGGKLKIKDVNNIIPAHNIGVAGSWNIGLSLNFKGDHLLIICNDDNLLKPKAIEELVLLAKKNPEHGFFSSLSGGFSLFALRPSIAVNTVGYFDEGFYPAYFEDNDYHYRMKLNNLDFIKTQEEIYELGVKGEGSQTLNSDMTSDLDRRAIHIGFQSNQLRYEAKWGGKPSEEIYTEAFNLKI
jgi:GT2 family glycosyltransferase